MSIFAQLLIDSILIGSVYALMSIGLSVAFGVTRIMNFSHGEFIMLGAYGAFWMLSLWGVDPLLSLPILIVVGFIAGWSLFHLAIKRILDAPHLNQILLTFGITLVLQNLAVVMWSGDVRSATPSYATASWVFGDLFVIQARFIAFVVAVIVIGGLLLWLYRTEAGKAVRAVSQNRQAATLMGIDTQKMFGLSFALSCALGVACGVVVSFLVNITPFMGFPMLIKAIAIVILGGLGSVGGTVIGAFILAGFESMVSYYVPEGAGWAEGIAFILIIAILIFRPFGLRGSSQVS